MESSCRFTPRLGFSPMNCTIWKGYFCCSWRTFEFVDPDIGLRWLHLHLKVCNSSKYFMFLQKTYVFLYFLSLIDKPWWKSGDRTDPFNGGVLYIKRKVGSCSYSDDPIGCQSLLSRAMHEVILFSCSSDKRLCV